MSEICSKLTKRHQSDFIDIILSGIFVNFEQILKIVPAFRSGCSALNGVNPNLKKKKVHLEQVNTVRGTTSIIELLLSNGYFE